MAKSKAPAAAANRRNNLMKLVALKCGVREICDLMDERPKPLRDFAYRNGITLVGLAEERPYTPKETSMPGPGPSSKSPPPSTPSAHAMKGQVQAVRLLDEHFNAEKGFYAEGWNDDRIAKTVGLAPALITSMRTTAYGEIRVNPEIAAVKAEIALISKRASEVINDLNQKLASLSARVDRIGGAR